MFDEVFDKLDQNGTGRVSAQLFEGFNLSPLFRSLFFNFQKQLHSFPHLWSNAHTT